MNSKNIVIERLFDAPIEIVWQALTERNLMQKWYFDIAEFKPEKGFKFQFMGGPSPEKQYLHRCEVKDAVVHKKLSYSWRYDQYYGISLVTFELFAQGRKTRLKLTHSGIDSFPHDNKDFAIGNFVEGWNYLVHTSLKAYLASVQNETE